jgi:hypothetical protein
MKRLLISLLAALPQLLACSDATVPTDPAEPSAGARSQQSATQGALSSTLATSGHPQVGSLSRQAEEIRRTERERLRSLVEANLAVARRLHADDFELINPAGVLLSKEQYLGSIESGLLDYRAWDAGEIAVRIHGNFAVIRYQDVRFEVFFGGQLVHRGETYHTNLYEKRHGQWQAVWSQASGGEMVTP